VGLVQAAWGWKAGAELSMRLAMWRRHSLMLQSIYLPHRTAVAAL
jgi:hypothetical protein